MEQQPPLPICLRAAGSTIVASYSPLSTSEQPATQHEAQCKPCGEGTSTCSVARQRWEADIAVVHEVNRSLYSNRIHEAERICALAMEQPPLPAADRVSVDGVDTFRDARGLMAMLSALFHAARGGLEMDRDNLSASLPGMYRAERLLSEAQPPWAASHLARGICEATIGVLLCMQYNFVKGGWHLLKAYGAMRNLNISELLDYPGMEHDVVRSLALFFLGTKALILELLPPAATRWLPGFRGRGDRVEGLRMLRACVSEGSIFRYAAMDALLAYHVGLKEILFLPWTDTDWAEVEALTHDAEEELGRTAFIHGTKAACALGWRRESAAALERVREIAADPLLRTLPGLLSMLEMEEGNYLLAACRCDKAAVAAPKSHPGP